MTFLRRAFLLEQFAAAGLRDWRRVRPRWMRPWRSSWRSAIASSCMTDVRPALERLRSKYRLFAVSNGNADLYRCGIADLFEGHVTASAAGAAKPDARIFAHLLRDAGVETHRSAAYRR
jgi:HAD superfamily hydrolase (TIGR01549 family)